VFSVMSKLKFLCCAGFFLLIGLATVQAQAPEASSPVIPSSNAADMKAVREKLDSLKIQLDQTEAGLSRENLRDVDLQDIRQRAEPLVEAARKLVEQIIPRVETAKSRFEQIGPLPAPPQPPEADDVQRERGERQSALNDAEQSLRLARALVLQGEQISTTALDRRRALFARALFARHSGFLSPSLWADVIHNLPRDARATATVLSDWFKGRVLNAEPFTAIPIILVFVFAAFLYGFRWRVMPRLMLRDARILTPSRKRKVLSAAGVLAMGTLPAIIGSMAIYHVLDATNLLPFRLAPVVWNILGGFAFVAFIHALCEALFAPGKNIWRLVALSEASALHLTRFAVVLAVLMASGKVFEALSGAIAAALPVSIALRGSFALAAALISAAMLWRINTVSQQDDECLGPYIAQDAPLAGPLRMLGWSSVTLVITSVLAGYMTFASFLIDQIFWVAILGALLLLGLILADELIGRAFEGDTKFISTVQANTGIRRRSLEQLGVLGGGLARIVLILIAVLLALAPWGVESNDLLSSLRAAFFGFQVGDITISLSAIAAAVAIFAFGFAITRIFQSWLDNTFLPKTDLDPGLRNSIRTALGYAGFVLAAAMAFSYLGLGLDKLTIVAGALSVGIGFGLQSIVNNFVSGLILLWERPIRVGDLIVVGDGEGHVRKISVRATEIETFDRSTIIVPNSNLISGTVRNRVRSGRMGRVVVPVSVLRSNDPERVSTLLIKCADAHEDVLGDPAPRVLFKKIADSNLDFELICYVSDVDRQAKVLSDLNFALFRFLKDESMIPPLGPAVMEVKGLEPVDKGLNRIAEAIDRHKDKSHDNQG
jgi:potassium-dependent mechanosensitive channel